MITESEKKIPYHKDYKEPIYRSIGSCYPKNTAAPKVSTLDFKSSPPSSDSSGKIKYAIFRVGKRYHLAEINQITTGFQVHMNRDKDILNACKELKELNELLVGTKGANIQEDVEAFIVGAKTKVDSVIATDILLTASSDFFHDKLSNKDIKKWVELNKRYIKERFGNTCRYAMLHKDECGGFHVHCLIVPKMTNDKGIEILNNKELFGGAYKLTKWQSDYSSYMQQEFVELQRGIKGTGKYRASYPDIKNWYAYMKEPLDENNLESVKIKARLADHLQHRVNILEHMVKEKDYVQEQIKDKNVELKVENVELKVEKGILAKAYTELKKNNDVYLKVITEVSKEYNISVEEIKEVVKSMDSKDKGKDKSISKGKER